MSTANISVNEYGTFITGVDLDLDTDIHISFRDGEHFGEALLDDIREHYNDGELSENTKSLIKKIDN